MLNRKFRRLFWDIETSPNIVLAFRAGYDQLIRPESIIHERKIICIAYKWEGQDKVSVLRWDSNQDDKALLTKFIAVASEADELVAHFGDRYDKPFVAGRCVIHHLSPLSIWKTVDTKAWASKYYYFNSNKLDYLAKVLGHGGKLETDLQLWIDILMHKSKKALDYMCKYCGVDVVKLEMVYHDLKFCVKPKSHQGVYEGGDKWSCPRDGSTNVRRRKIMVSAAGTIQHQMVCLDCGGHYVINQSSYERYLEFKIKNKGNGKKGSKRARKTTTRRN